MVNFAKGILDNLAELISRYNKPLVLVGGFGASVYSSDAEGAVLKSATNAFKSGTGKFAVTLARRSANAIKLGERELFKTPEPNTMTLIQATQWYREQLAKFKASKDWVDSNLPMQAQAEQAMRIHSLMLQGMKRAVYGNGEATTAEFRGALAEAKIEIPDTLTISAAREKINKTGEPLFQALRDKYMKLDLPALRYEPACFAAGTLVHTKEGLKPIETIKVGDWVLSKHESGEGERAYKRVTQTFKHEDREVIKALCCVVGTDKVKRDCNLVVTAEHPIWVQGKGWKPAGKLKNSLPRTVLEVVEGIYSYVGGTVRMFKTDQPGVAWVPMSSSGDQLKQVGSHLEVSSMTYIRRHDVWIDFESVRKTKRVKPEHLYATTVYNLEVEDFHTYYVGEAGVWVHNKNIQVSALAAQGYTPTALETSNAFSSRSELNGYLKKLVAERTV